MKSASLPILIVLILGICYASTIAPDLTWAHFSADGGDLIAAVATGGVPHPGGYPLYLLVAHLFQFLPVGSLAFRTNILSAVPTILTALLLYKYILLQSNDAHAHWVALTAGLAYGLAPLVWGQALVTEVYALHASLLLLCLYVLSLDPGSIHEWTRGFVFGIAATNHLTALFIAPLLLLDSNGVLVTSPVILKKRFLGLGAGLLLYLTLPVRAYFDPPVNWSDASTLDGFISLISGQIYRQYAFDITWVDMLQRVQAFAGLLLQQFTWIGALFGVYGLLLPMPRKVLIPTAWTASAFLLFAITYGSRDSQVNLLPFWLVFAIWLAHGLQQLLNLLPDRNRLRSLAAIMLFVMVLARIPIVRPAVDASKDTRAVEFLVRALHELPRDSLVILDGDEQIFSLWYAQLALKQRLDLRLVAEGLVSYPWYLESLQNTYSDMVVPRNMNISVEDLVAANMDRTLCRISSDRSIVCVHR